MSDNKNLKSLNRRELLFTLIGSIVVLSMGTLLVVKKRMTKVVYTK